MGQIVDIILVPQGAEYRAVRRGLGATAIPILPIPIGAVPLRQQIHRWQNAGQLLAGQRILVMGLCGGLVPRRAIADVVLYRECIDRAEFRSTFTCDAALTQQIQAKLAGHVTLVNALTSDRLVWSAHEKQQLAQRYDAEVVDMEAVAAIASLTTAGAVTAMLRVVSDDAQHDLPDLTAAIGADGSLRAWPLALGMLKQPIAASRLIRGSLRSLKTLQAIATRLGREP